MSTLSEVGIANLAVVNRLGAKRIVSFGPGGEDSPAARAVAGAYEPVRDALLRSYRWGFAIKRAQLAADTTQTAFDNLYQYPVPTDFLRLLKPANRPDLDWAIEGSKIVTSDSAPLNIRYIARITDTALFDPLFVLAFAARLAHEMCETLTGSNTKRQALEAEFAAAIATAKRTAAIEKVPEDIVEDSYLTVARVL